MSCLCKSFDSRCEVTGEAIMGDTSSDLEPALETKCHNNEHTGGTFTALGTLAWWAKL